MSTGQTSASCAATAGSCAAPGATSTAMKRLDTGAPALGDGLLDEVGDVLDALRDRYAGLGQTRDLLGRGVLAPLDDRPGVAERHPRHLVHEAARHERDDRQAGPGLAHPARQL